MQIKHINSILNIDIGVNSFEISYESPLDL